MRRKVATNFLSYGRVIPLQMFEGPEKSAFPRSSQIMILAQHKSGGFYFQPMPFIYTPAF